MTKPPQGVVRAHPLEDGRVEATRVSVGVTSHHDALKISGCRAHRVRCGTSRLDDLLAVSRPLEVSESGSPTLKTTSSWSRPTNVRSVPSSTCGERRAVRVSYSSPAQSRPKTQPHITAPASASSPRGQAGRPSSSALPITPASYVLHELLSLKKCVVTLSMPRLISGIGAALGAHSRVDAITTTSGPLHELNAETMGSRSPSSCRRLADIQRAAVDRMRPDRACRLMWRYGRHGESPVPIRRLDAADCFAMAFESVRIAFKYMTPLSS